VAEQIRPHVAEGWAISGPFRERRRGVVLSGHVDIARRHGSYEHWSFALRAWVEVDEPGRLELRAQVERTNGDEYWNLRHVTRGEIDAEAALQELLGAMVEDWSSWVDLIDGLPPID
jgi:hypothetical protein